MTTTHRAAFAALTALLLSSCAQFGPRAIVSADQKLLYPDTREPRAAKPGKDQPNPPMTWPIKRFYDAQFVAKAWDERLAVETTGFASNPNGYPTPVPTPTPSPTPSPVATPSPGATPTPVPSATPSSTFDTAKYFASQRRMLEAGFTLINETCNDFFNHSGRTQTRLMTGRDAVSTFGSLATGSLALIKFKDANLRDSLLAAVGLGTSTTLAGIDIYTQRYLFGAENIDSVRDLTLNALGSQQKKVRDLYQRFTFDEVITVLLDTQSICLPSHIAMLVRTAIKESEVVSKENAATPGSEALSTAQDNAVLLRLKTDIGATEAVTDAQLLGLWWFVKMQPTDAELPVIAALLKDLPDGIMPIDATGKRVTGKPGQAVATALDSVTVATGDKLRAEVEKRRAAIKAGKPIVAPTVPVVPAPEDKPADAATDTTTSAPADIQSSNNGRVITGIKTPDN